MDVDATESLELIGSKATIQFSRGLDQPYLASGEYLYGINLSYPELQIAITRGVDDFAVDTFQKDLIAMNASLSGTASLEFDHCCCILTATKRGRIIWRVELISFEESMSGVESWRLQAEIDVDQTSLTSAARFFTQTH